MIFLIKIHWNSKFYRNPQPYLTNRRPQIRILLLPKLIRDTKEESQQASNILGAILFHALYLRLAGIGKKNRLINNELTEESFQVHHQMRGRLIRTDFRYCSWDLSGKSEPINIV